MAKPPVGTIGWIDLTVPKAGATKNFYETVVGWTSEEVEMGGYSDYTMLPPEGEEPEVGICNARGVNAGLPAQWLIYITVADLTKSMAAVTKLGGAILREPQPADEAGRYCVIRDPAGAVCALYEASEDD